MPRLLMPEHLAEGEAMGSLFKLPPELVSARELVKEPLERNPAPWSIPGLRVVLKVHPMVELEVPDKLSLSLPRAESVLLEVDKLLLKPERSKGDLAKGLVHFARQSVVMMRILPGP